MFKVPEWSTWCLLESVVTVQWRSVCCVPDDCSACRGSCSSAGPQTHVRQWWTLPLQWHSFYSGLVSAVVLRSASGTLQPCKHTQIVLVFLLYKGTVGGKCRCEGVAAPFWGHRGVYWGERAAIPGRLAGSCCWTGGGWSTAQIWPPQGHSWSSFPSTFPPAGAQTPRPPGT